MDEHKFNKEYLDKHIVEYEERLVAFFDFQGFRDTIINDYSCEAIGAVFGLNATIAKILQTDYEDLQITIISDSIVISTTIKEQTNIIAFFEACIYFAKPRIGSEFIAVRGGIAYGKLHHKDNIVFGPALIDAYNLAENQVKPKLLKILMEKKTFEVLKQNKLSAKYLYKLMISQKEDDKYYLDSWYMLFLVTDDMELTNKQINDMESYIFWIIDNLQKYENNNNEIYNKYFDLLERTIISFVRIKDDFFDVLSENSKEIVNLCSDINEIKKFIMLIKANDGR